MTTVTAITLESTDFRALEEALKKLLDTSSDLSYRFQLKPAFTSDGVRKMRAEVAYDALTPEQVEVIGKVYFANAVTASIRMR